MTTPTPYNPTPYTAAPASTNVLSIVAFVLSLLGFNVIAVVLGFIGLNQVKKTGEKGRGFALAAVIIGLASVVLGVIALIFFFAIAATGMSIQ